MSNSVDVSSRNSNLTPVKRQLLCRVISFRERAFEVQFLDNSALRGSHYFENALQCWLRREMEYDLDIQEKFVNSLERDF